MRPPRQFVGGNSIEDSSGNFRFLAEFTQHWFKHFVHFSILLVRWNYILIVENAIERAAPRSGVRGWLLDTTAMPRTAPPAPFAGRSRLTLKFRFRFQSQSTQSDMLGTLAIGPGCRSERSTRQGRGNA